MNYIGKPFKDLARGPDKYDCWGLVKHFYKYELGIELPEYYISAYDTVSVQKTMSQDKKFWKKVNGPKLGTLVAIALTGSSLVNHVGVCIDSYRFIHALNKTGVIATRLDDIKFSSRIMGLYEWI